MNDLVLIHHNEPMTTSLAIAEGVQLQHKNVIELIRKHVESLSAFGRVAFETRPFETDGGNQWRDIAYLNEPQSTLLVTFMRNSEVVVKFKIALVKAFYELRDRLQSTTIPHHSEPLSLSHRADILVSADRTFRAALRSGRSAGLRMTQALRRANEIALQNTGINMLAALQAEDIAVEPAAPIKRDYGIPSFLAEWKDERLPVPHCICRSSAFYDAYVMWCGENDASPARITQFAGLAQRADPSLEKFITGIPVDGGGMHSVRVIVPHGARRGQEAGEWTRHVASECARFAAALVEWKDAA